MATVFAGWLTDKTTTRRLPFLISLLVLFISAGIFLFAYSPGILLLARILGGGASAAVYTVGLAILVDTVGQGKMGAWMGFALSGMGVGILVGPALGGFVYANAGYFAVFWTLMGIIALQFVLTIFMVESKTADKYTTSSKKEEGYGTFPDGSKAKDQHSISGLDNGARLSADDTTASSSTLLAKARDEPEGGTAHNPSTSQSGREASLDPTKTSSIEPSKLGPVLKRLLGSPRLLTAIYGSFLYVSLFAGIESILPNYMHQAFGWDSSRAGSVFLAISVPHLMTPVMGALSDRLGPRKVVLSGFAFATTSIALLALIRQSDVGHVVLLVALLLCFGIDLRFPYMWPTPSDLIAIILLIGRLPSSVRR